MHESVPGAEAFALALADILTALGQRPGLLPQLGMPRSIKAALLDELRPLRAGSTAELAPPVTPSTPGPTRLGRMRRAARHCLKPKVYNTPCPATVSWFLRVSWLLSCSFRLPWQT